jgi:hypothetical protein
MIFYYTLFTHTHHKLEVLYFSEIMPIMLLQIEMCVKCDLNYDINV